MPNFPSPPQRRRSSTVVPIVAHIAGAPVIPAATISSRVRTPGVVFNSQSVGLSEYEVSGAFSGSVTVHPFDIYPGFTQNVVKSVPLITFPSPFTLVSGTSGLVLVSSTLSPNNVIPAGALIGNASATFLYGANSTPSLGPLSPGLTYTQPTVSVTLTVANISSSVVHSFPFVIVVQAILLGAVISAR